MKTLRTILIVLVAAAVVAWPQVRFTIGFGFPTVTGATFSLNAAASGGYSQNWIGYGFNPRTACTINAVKMRVTSVTGTLGANDLTLDVFNDSSGVPGTSQASTSTVTTTPTGATWVEFTGLSYATSPLTQYWLVARNANATPTSNYATYVYMGAPGLEPNASSGPFGPFVRTYNGTTWAGSSNSTPSYRIQCSDGSYHGYPFQGGSATTAVSNEYVYSGQQFAASFTTPQGPTLNVNTINWQFQKSGTPTGQAKVVVYSPSATLCTSDTAISPSSIDATPRWTGFVFLTPCSLPPNTAIKVALMETSQSDGSANSFRTSVIATENDSNSLALVPFNGTLRGAYCASSCSATATWTTSYNLPVFSMQLTTGSEFTVSGGGSGQKSSVWVQ